MENETLVLIAACVGSFCAGVINAFAWLGRMQPDDRDNFLRGALDGIDVRFWWRRFTKRST